MLSMPNSKSWSLPDLVVRAREQYPLSPTEADKKAMGKIWYQRPTRKDSSTLIEYNADFGKKQKGSSKKQNSGSWLNESFYINYTNKFNKT